MGVAKGLIASERLKQKKRFEFPLRLGEAAKGLIASERLKHLCHQSAVDTAASLQRN